MNLQKQNSERADSNTESAVCDIFVCDSESAWHKICLFSEHLHVALKGHQGLQP